MRSRVASIGSMTIAGQSSIRDKRAGTRMPRGRGGVPGVRAGWRAMLLAVLLAFSWQSFITQTHRHFAPAATAAALGKAGIAARQPGRQLPSDTPASCPICSEIAHAGPIMLPAPVEVIAPAAASFHAADTRPLTLALLQRSHAWRSRAPPSLQG